ncbi:hypothetical protein ZOSMA_491G00010 [Zostera marina]|uniref:HECT-type E3 ubiquitin transferase n=1 Tax=Zostera marina TaxID=29655 RepID=A0A0K9NZC5_ZOSMR|nr:hypothetical protein ZOSMA_491G00010 [Zostera marina]
MSCFKQPEGRISVATGGKHLAYLEISIEQLNETVGMWTDKTVQIFSREAKRVIYSLNACNGKLLVAFNQKIQLNKIECIMTVLAYRTEIVQILWNFISRCHLNQQWQSFSRFTSFLPIETPGWLLPFSVFCPVYKHMIMIVDNEEFYEQEKSISLEDIQCLIIILRQVLWEFLWSNSANSSAFQKGPSSSFNKLSLDGVKNKVKFVTSELLSQLQDWNNRWQFTPFSDFNVQEAVDESFFSIVQ